ncbi:MAG: hypothetical protein J1E79_01100 [Rikenella sp.]|nr:hypothetical protein [Rikenella sp.]
MKTKHLFFTLLAACGIALSASAAAPCSEQNTGGNTREEATAIQSHISVRVFGLQSGSVIATVTDNGHNYAFAGSADGNIGEFYLEGSYCTVELTFNGVSPAFSRLASSANLTVEQISDNKYRVAPFDGTLVRQGEIVVLFGE